MKLSTHTIVVPDYPAKNEYLLYHTRTQGMVKVNQDLKNVIDNFNSLSDDLKTPHQDNLDALYKMQILIKNDNEDKERLKDFLQQLKFSIRKKSFPVTILTTYSCNFKCVYCFEESSRAHQNMDEHVQKGTIEWMKEKIEQDGYQQLYLNFYGGEPLINKAAIDYIVPEMKSWCQERGVKFKFMLQTNGYFLTPELVDKYLSMGLDQVRISVDGLREVHDKNRPLRGGGGTFDRVMKNIVDSVEKVKIGISTSYEKDDITHIEQLMNYFEELGILNKLGAFLFSPIHPSLGPDGDLGKLQRIECMCNHEDTYLANAATKIRSLMEQKNLPIKGGMAVSACPLVSEHSGMTIDQEGKLYKCNSMLGHKDLAIGSVFHERFNTKQKEFRDLDVWQQCPQDCTYLPMCSGGCRLMSFLETKSFNAPACKKPYLNRMAPEFIKKEYEELMSKKNYTNFIK
ncbi:hypothetical protein MNBD_UNCLBAC01-473 [hydrothermal vent metagenome]|uniref:Radical SAM core domain-containing protein n=1 Tax=hydrothermal vent metagenome TaxID=652676 RepID=A0A3B1CY53_9ZZZZ